MKIFSYLRGVMSKLKASSNILTIGIDYLVPMGGVAQVEAVYKDLFQPFKFIRTVVSGNNKLLKGYVFVEALVRFIWRLSTDSEIKIVHIHGASGASFWRKRFFIRIAKSWGKLVVYHIHGGSFKLFTAKHHRRVIETLHLCDCIVALSESWREYFVSECGCKNVVVIRNIIESPYVCKQGSSLFILLFLGRLGKNKGIYDLLSLLAENKEEYRGKLLLRFGGDGEVEQCKRFIKDNGIDDIVRYEGWVSGEAKIELLNESDAYILPSYNEGLPISILEAMSYSLPIISTNVGGIPEVVHDGANGFLIAPGDKRAMKGAIDALMNDQTLRTTMGNRSREMVQPHMKENVQAQLEELYDTLVKAL